MEISPSRAAAATVAETSAGTATVSGSSEATIPDDAITVVPPTISTASPTASGGVEIDLGRATMRHPVGISATALWEVMSDVVNTVCARSASRTDAWSGISASASLETTA